MKRAVSLFILVMMLVGAVHAQVGTSQDQTKYERKSISYINALWLASPSAKAVDGQQVSFMLTNVKSWIEMDRFDFNPLPDKLINEFVTAANAQPTVTVEGLAGLMEQKLVPQITKILSFEMDMRAQNLVSEVQRNGFLAQKAKETGITLEQIEKIMNSAYLYLPVLTAYEMKKGEKDTYTSVISGGIIWFHIDNSGNSPIVKLKVAKNTQSTGFGSQKCAFQSAVNNFSRNLQTASRDIPEFKLGAPIAEADGNNITMALGNKEGISIDDTYLTGEWQMDAAGNTNFVTNGWVKIGSVADNKKDATAKSKAWGVKNPGYAVGMQTIEYPRLGIDVGIKPGVYFMTLQKGFFRNDTGDTLGLHEDYTGPAVGGDLDFQVHIAKQTFLLLGFTAAIPTPDINVKSNGIDPNNFSNVSSSSLIWGVNAGLMKKLYMGRMVLGLDVKAGYKVYQLTQSWTRGGVIPETIEFNASNASIGGQVDVSLEVAVAPNFNFGIIGGMKFFSASTDWTIDKWTTGSISGYETTELKNFPSVDHSGLAIGIYMHFTPASLPFDPVDLFKGMALGNDYCD